MKLSEAAFAGAAALYALWGSPTPDRPDWAEWSILALLGMAILCGGIDRRVCREAWSGPWLGLLAYAFSVPVLMGALSGNTPSDMLRDMIAFGALGLPIWLYGYRNAGFARVILLGIGLTFSIRYLISPVIGMAGPDYGLLYLANSPLVAFAATYLLLHGCFVEKNAVRAGLCVIAALLPVLAMAGMMQRATLALLVLAWSGFLLRCVVIDPRRGITVLILTLVLTGFFIAEITGLYETLIDKTRAVGWNARGAEFTAILETQSENPLVAMLGSGWGSMFKSPAVGDMWVRFSHSFLTSLWWKTGWLGLVLGSLALATALLAARKRLAHDPVLFAAFILPLIPALFLYGSYKSLCFGLLLWGLLVPDWTSAGRSVNQTAHDRETGPPVDHDSKPRIPADARGDGATSA